MRITKLLAFATVLVAVIAAPIAAQPYFGATVPLGYVTADVEDLNENRFTTGIVGKGGVQLGMYGLEGQLGYTSHIYSVEVLGEDYSAYLNYLRLGLLAKVYPASIFYAGLGAEFSFLVGSGVASGGESYNQQSEAQEGPIYAATEAGVELPVGPNLTVPIGAFFNYAVGNVPTDTRLMELGVEAGLKYQY
ncbi:MAG: hypothetical protein ACOCY8_08210 [Spirochaetota bacterium]